MDRLPDAPWIRDAEVNGFGDPDPPKCPVCGEECETIINDMYGNVFGCDRCIVRQDAWDWLEAQKEADRDDS